MMTEVSINKSMKLSPHFTLGEMCKTSYHTDDGNIPSRVAIGNLKRLCIWLEDLRFSYNELYGEGDRSQETGDSRNDGEIPIIISSGYRSEEVNRKCGGQTGAIT